MINDGGGGNDTGGREVSDDDDGEDGTCVIIQLWMKIMIVTLIIVSLMMMIKMIIVIIMMQSYRQSEFCGNSVSRIRPRLGGLPHLETFTWQNLSPAERVTRTSGRPGYPPSRITPPIM